jgi:RNA polymerase sigma factor (TIGR02999 family)
MADAHLVTSLLQGVQRRDAAAEEQLLQLVYAQLHRLAERLLAREGPACTVQATMLVHDAWLGLIGTPDGNQDAPRFEHRAHFFAAAARAMRNLLVDHARRRQAARRGGDALRVTFHDLAVADAGGRDLDVLALHEALEQLEQRSPGLARVVELRFFAGLDLEQIAATTGRSAATVKREWTYARAWLHERLAPDAPGARA